MDLLVISSFRIAGCMSLYRSWLWTSYVFDHGTGQIWWFSWQNI